jgi:predicted Zn-dependent peptidase
MLQNLLFEMLQVSFGVKVEEFERAKNQLKSSIFMTLESRSALADDIGRQVMMYGKRHSAEEIGKKIDGLKVKECCEMLRDIMRKNVTVVGYGEGVEELPDAKDIKRFLNEQLR